ncbi:MAG: DNA polymerase III subunit delta [Candidatus Portiera sp.]|nr:DNA polymerase III subunit delta [Portiera sp.]
MKPVHIVAADEIFLREESIAAITKEAIKEGYPKPRKFFLGDDSQHKTILLEAANPSLFEDKKTLLLICNDLPLKQDAENMLMEATAAADGDVLFILSMPRLSPAIRQKKWFKQLTRKDIGEYIALYTPSGAKLISWLGQRAQKLKLNLDREALEFLAQNSEGNLLGAVQELEKLQLAHGEASLDYEQVKKSSGDGSYYDLFTLSDSMLSGDILRCRRMLKRLQELKEAPTKIIWLVTKDINMLLAIVDNPRISDQELYRYSCFGPRQSMARNAARRFAGKDRVKLKVLLRLLSMTDQAAKGASQDDPWQLLEGAILRLAGLPTPAAISYLKHPNISLP